MKLLLLIALLIMVLLIIGLLLPAERTFTKTATLPHSSRAIWQVITDARGQERWRDDVKEIVVHSAQTGQEKWTEIPQRGPALTFRTKTYEPYRRFDIEIVESKIQGYWEGRLTERGSQKTDIVFQEVVTTANPFARVFTYGFVDLDATMERYLENLTAELDRRSQGTTK